MIRTIWRIVRDPEDAKDALQEALATIWKRYGKVERHANPRALILRICLNAAYDVLRRRIRRNRILHSNPVSQLELDPATCMGDRLSERERQAEILEAIRHLSAKQAQAFLMRILHEESYDTIAVALGCSEATARTHVKRARSHLTQHLSHLVPHFSQETNR